MSTRCTPPGGVVHVPFAIPLNPPVFRTNNTSLSSVGFETNRSNKHNFFFRELFLQLSLFNVDLLQ